MTVVYQPDENLIIFAMFFMVSGKYSARKTHRLNLQNFHKVKILNINITEILKKISINTLYRSSRYSRRVKDTMLRKTTFLFGFDFFSSLSAIYMWRSCNVLFYEIILRSF